MAELKTNIFLDVCLQTELFTLHVKIKCKHAKDKLHPQRHVSKLQRAGAQKLQLVLTSINIF